MKDIYKNFGIVIENTKLLEIALTHSSYANEHNVDSYERLEYLGDATLEIVCSEYLYKNTNFVEGKMSKLRSLYVCENALYEYSKDVKLANYIKIGNGINKPNKTIIADVFEATMAVIYLEKGLDGVKTVFNNLKGVLPQNFLKVVFEILEPLPAIVEDNKSAILQLFNDVAII